MNPYDGLNKAEFDEMMDPEYRKKWPTKGETLCEENSKLELAEKYLRAEESAKFFRDERDTWIKSNEKLLHQIMMLEKENESLKKEIDVVNNRLISYRLGAFVAKIFSKIGYVRK